MRPGPVADAERRQGERADRAFGVARHGDQCISRYRRMQRARQQRLGIAWHFESELQDFRLWQLPGFGIEVAHDRQSGRDWCQIEGPEERHQATFAAARPLKAGMTSRANSLRLARTSVCGIASWAFSRKLTRSTPTSSQRLITRVTRSGPPS